MAGFHARQTQARIARLQISAAEIERIGRAYRERFDTVAAICRRHQVQPGDIVALANRYGWPLRGMGTQRPGAQKSRNYKKAPKPRTEAEVRADRQAEEQARERALYGRHVDDVAILRRRGFGINREGDRIRFGNSLITFAELRAKADRERRLLEPPGVVFRWRKPARAEVRA